MTLHEPPTPLVAIVFDQQASYASYAEPELKEASGSVIGYYSLHTNRIAMYDLTGVEQSRRGRRVATRELISAVLAAPDGERDGGHDHPRSNTSVGVQ